jgi:hypothetical protein
MANLRRKLRARGEPSASLEQSQEQAASEGESSQSAVARLSEYSITGKEPDAAEGNVTAPAEPVAGPAPEDPPADAGVPGDLSAVAEEVGTVLKSAREAGERIRQTAHEEAERLRNEAQAAAASEVAEARQIAEAERAEGNRVRAEAEAYANETRAAADAFAEQRRREAEREAAGIVDDAQKRLKAADAEVAQKVRQAEAKMRQRVDALQAEIKRYEERLESILVVFHGMSSQLEDLLGGRRPESSDGADAADEALAEALRPDQVRSRTG